ncbi:S-adenosyl-L-methionine-dependent methyltransferase [Phascolomyces articulosus]|uniref:S-adenosyl-L-methionine-dependent methyltransferase n=1 Tax=Phascolomyces articulosus TaxID=60185 RepID=A0AAD5JKZ0_9FUNG|nr:S-adenosyl-L-methionine-dependent methyltransferase [Phascolomyces articulosus]
MGNQLTKENHRPKVLLKPPQSKRYNTDGNDDHFISSHSQSGDHLYGMNPSSPRTTTTRPSPQPIRHQVVIADKSVAPLSLLASTSTSSPPPNQRKRTIRISRKKKRKDTNSFPSVHSLSSDNEEDYYYGSSPPPNTTTFHHHHHQQQQQETMSSSLGSMTSSSSMIVFDSAIASAEHAAADLARRQQQQQHDPSLTTSSPPLKKTNTWIYEYGKEKEYNRQLRQHYVLKQVFGGNQHVELNQPQDILECACGTGLWTLELAQAYPQCHVIGMDIVPPNNDASGLSHKSIPKNVTYTYGDVLAPLKYKEEQFDYIYQRDIAHIMPMHKWPSLIHEFYRILRPGGQVELVEYDLLFRNPGPVLALVNEWYKIAADTIGVDPSYVESLPGFLEEAGFENVHIEEYNIPIGEWPSDPAQRQFGFLYKEQMKALFQSMKRWWLSELHVSEQEYDRVCLSALEEFEEYHCIAKWKILTATKK